MVEAMRGTLSGDGAALQRYFKPTVAGHGRALDADLVPLRLSPARRGAPAAHRRPAQADVRVVELQLAGGDRSVMTIEPVRHEKSRTP